uniref:Uncharacterized protein n=1 Tax=Euplotes harpa TaxID=151035 RepID=A0A7S3JKE9_9SPIT|mmetsp:Transcript_41462/g.47827  ORF Transcript_41462/g.47827 Transcript_41462/m.47827 type:complete len:101 (+) Transcript_41462:462-764(+)
MTTVDYVIGNLPMLIADLPYIYVCASISDVSQLTGSNPLGNWYYVLMVVGLLIIVLVVALIYVFAKRELDNTLEKIQKQQEEGDDQRSHSHKSDQGLATD